MIVSALHIINYQHYEAGGTDLTDRWGNLGRLRENELAQGHQACDDLSQGCMTLEPMVVTTLLYCCDPNPSYHGWQRSF